MQEMTDLNREGKTLLYPRMIITRQCTTDELAEYMADETTFNPGEILGILRQLSKHLARQMADGHSVKIEGIGTFTPALSLREGKEREAPDGTGTRRNADSIRVSSVNFRPDTPLLDEVNRRCRLERSPVKYSRHVSEYTPEQRLALARRHLETHPTLSVREYIALTGLGRTRASEELRHWTETADSGIGIMGRGAHRLYVKKRKEGE